MGWHFTGCQCHIILQKFISSFFIFSILCLGWRIHIQMIFYISLYIFYIPKTSNYIIMYWYTSSLTFHWLLMSSNATKSISSFISAVLYQTVAVGLHDSWMEMYLPFARAQLSARAGCESLINAICRQHRETWAHCEHCGNACRSWCLKVCLSKQPLL